jgi:hypothetical protein
MGGRRIDELRIPRFLERVRALPVLAARVGEPSVPSRRGQASEKADQGRRARRRPRISRPPRNRLRRSPQTDVAIAGSDDPATTN